MENSKLEKQNRALTITLVLLLIPTVSLLTILGYRFFSQGAKTDILTTNAPARSNGTNASGSSAANAPAVNNGIPPATQNGTNASGSSATNAPAVNNGIPPATQNIAASDETFPLVGKWEAMMGDSKLTYIFEKPKKIGNTLTGNLEMIDNERPLEKLIYLVISTNKLKMTDEYGATLSDYLYSVSADGRSMDITINGRTVTFTRSTQ